MAGLVTGKDAQKKLKVPFVARKHPGARAQQALSLSALFCILVFFFFQVSLPLHCSCTPPF